jgi:hypothetical protein
MSLTFLFPVVDSILERGTGTMPREIFQCPNVKSLSLKNNFLEWLHPEVGNVFLRYADGFLNKVILVFVSQGFVREFFFLFRLLYKLSSLFYSQYHDFNMYGTRSAAG